MAIKKKAPAKKAAAPKVAAPVRPIKETLTKSALVKLIAEQNNLSNKQVGEVLSTIEGIMLGSVHPKGVGERAQRRVA
jgi:hypothetical protein